MWHAHRRLSRRSHGGHQPIVTSDALVWTNVKVLGHFEGANGGTVITDSSSFARTLTRNTNGGGVTTSTTMSRYGSTSLALNGGGNVSFADDAALEVGAGAFCIELSVYPLSRGASGNIFFDKRSSSAFGSIILYQTTTGALALLMSFDGSTYAINYTGTAGGIALNAWSDIALSRTAAGEISLYLNQSRVYTTTNAGTVHNSTSVWTLGAQDTAGSFPYHGYMDEFRFVVGQAVRTGASYVAEGAAFPDA